MCPLALSHQLLDIIGINKPIKSPIASFVTVQGLELRVQGLELRT